MLVDLERGGFLDLTFQLPHQFAVPDLLFERELRGYGGDELVGRGLLVAELDERELALTQRVRLDVPTLSLPDAFAFVLANQRGWTLLTGDGALRAYSAEKDLQVHGVLWVIDEMVRHDPASAQLLIEGLQAIAAHPRCRLPRAEITVRLGFLRTLL